MEMSILIGMATSIVLFAEQIPLRYRSAKRHHLTAVRFSVAC
jgi:hypothetical protein